FDAGFFPRAPTLGQSVNIDEAVTRGAEFAMRVPLAPAWQLSFNYTHTDSEQKSGDAAGQPLTNTPRHLVNTALHWEPIDRLSLYLRGEYRSARYRGEGPAQGQPGAYKPSSPFPRGGRDQAR